MLYLIQLLILCMACDPAKGTPQPIDVVDPPRIVPEPKPLPPTLIKLYEKDLQTREPLDQKLKVRLRSKNNEKAIAELQKIVQKQPKLSFLLAYSYINSPKPQRAVPYLQQFSAVKDVPNDYLQFTIGKTQLAAKRYEKAIEALELVKKESRLYHQAQMAILDALKQSKQAVKYQKHVDALLTGQHPMPTGAKLLYAKAQQLGLESAKAYPYLRTMWTQYPTAKLSKQIQPRLLRFEQKNPKNRPSNIEQATRIKRLMEKGRFSNIRTELQTLASKPLVFSKENCLMYYAYGRSLYKVNQVTDAAKLLKQVGEKCRTLDPDSGARALYVAGKSLERKKSWLAAAVQYEKIPRYYPEHSMADDGYTLAGICHQEAGNSARALKMWKKQVEQYPAGDMLAEGYWRWAWHTYLSGNTPTAIQIAEQSQQVVPIQGDPVHAFALRYWASRWKLHPYKNYPSKRNSDSKVVAQAIDELVALCTSHPTRFYSLLAAQRIYEHDAKRAKKLMRPAWSEPKDYWEVQEAFYQNKKLQKAMKLKQLGLDKEAYLEIKDLSPKHPNEQAVLSTIHKPISWIAAHDSLHRFLNKHPPGVYLANHKKVLLHAYPNKYFSLIQSLTTDYQYDPRIFHSLVREESSFNPKIKSWAGARGLSQLMPRTARSVASKQFGMRVRLNDLFVPKTNLKLGSRYFQTLIRMFQGNPFLAVPSYNAGQGNIGKWLKSKGNLPTDAFIESIPIRETRAYVKRVLGTYQIYRTVRHTDTLYPNWSRYNHKAQPNSP